MAQFENVGFGIKEFPKMSRKIQHKEFSHFQIFILSHYGDFVLLHHLVCQ